MLKDIKNTIKQSAIYGLSRITSKMTGIVLLPLYTLHFAVKEYGVYILTDSLFQILLAIFLFGLETGVIKYYLDIEDVNRRKRFLFSVTLCLFCIDCIFNLIIFIFLNNLLSLIYPAASYSQLIIYASLLATVESFSFVVFLLLRMEEKVKMYTVFSILGTSLSLILQIYSLQIVSDKLGGVFISRLVGATVIIIFLSPYYISRLKIGLEINLIKELLRYSIPIMLASIVLTLLNQTDKYILGYLTNIGNAGIYGLAYNISGLLGFLIVSPFFLAFTVIFWKKIKDKNAKRFYSKSVTYLFFSISYGALILSLFTPHLIKIFTLRTDYWMASKYVPWVALSLPFYGIHGIGEFSFFVTKKNYFIVFSYLIALSINIILNIVFIPIFEIYGAAFVNLISFMVLNICLYLFSKKNYFIKYEWIKLMSVMVCYCLLVIPFFYFEFGNHLFEIILKCFACLVFPFLLYLLKFYEPIELERIKGFINKYIINFSYKV